MTQPSHPNARQVLLPNNIFCRQPCRIPAHPHLVEAPLCSHTTPLRHGAPARPPTSDLTGTWRIRRASLAPRQQQLHLGWQETFLQHMAATRGGGLAPDASHALQLPVGEGQAHSSRAAVCRHEPHRRQGTHGQCDGHRRAQCMEADVDDADMCTRHTSWLGIGRPPGCQESLLSPQVLPSPIRCTRGPCPPIPRCPRTPPATGRRRS